MLFTAWGCSTPPEPVSSSLPGTLAVKSSGAEQRVAAGISGLDVPSAAPPIEGQYALPTPDPDNGAGTLLIYTAITGHQSIGSGPRHQTSPADPQRWTAAGEESRGRSLEAQIEEELRRQQAALDGIQASPAEQPTIEAMIAGQTLAEHAKPWAAPDAPKERKLPLSVFEMENVTILPGSWGNEEPLKVTRGILDADRDGVPEQIRFFDRETKVLLRKEVDSNYDGSLDTWSTYKDGMLVSRLRDTNRNGDVDVWESYAEDRMTDRTIDRDHDHIADAFYQYSGGILAEERHDVNNDGVVDRRISYQNLFRSYAEEDRDLDGSMDNWTTYGVSQGKEVVIRIERASTGSGAPDIFEIYDTSSGKSVLVRREEDRNQDGSIDVISRYKNGKLVQREISNPDLAPL
jgi:hypothetical protein